MKKEIFLNGKKIVYYEEGNGFPFIIIHGWGGSVSPLHNLKFQEYLAKRGFRVFVIALPGFGESSLPNLKTKTDDFIDCIAEFCEELNLKKCIIYGHCLGGFVALKFTKFYPNLTKALILYGVPSPKLTKFLMAELSYFWLIPLVVFAYAFRLLMPPVFFLRNLRNWFQKQYIFYTRGQVRMLKAIRKLFSRGFNESISAISEPGTPTLVIRGAKENFFITNGCNFFSKFPKANYEIVPNFGHSLQIEAPEKLSKIITNFANSIKQP